MIRLFTHNDLDGLGGPILASIAYGVDAVTFDSCRYEDINEKVMAYIEEKEFLNYDKCFITDISVNEEVAKYISETTLSEGDKTYVLSEHFQLLDHHITAMPLNAFNWCHVEDTDAEGIKCSGTALFYRYLLTLDAPFKENLTKHLTEVFVEKIRRYDTWDWAKFEDLEAKQLNDLFYLLGKERFMEYWCTRLSGEDGEFAFDETQKLILDIRQNEIDKYIESRDEDLIEREILGKRAGIVFADRYQSELGNKLAQLHPELDFIAMINVGGGVSCRTIKEDINLGTDIAAIFGGGGHAKAAGLPVKDEIREMVIQSIFTPPEN
nr:hypothetical protein [uncultured Cellulosilyticum sp.]